VVFSIADRPAVRRTLATLASSVALFTGLLTGTAAAAGPQGQSEVEPMIPCPGTPTQCMVMYSHPNYRGSEFNLSDSSANGCVYQTFINQPVTSYDNRNSRLEGYLYAGTKCDGTRVAIVRKGSRNPNIGGIALSFRITCISCREEG
jgi:hypothetical protein